MMMMMQQPPTGGGAVHPWMIDQPTTTTSTTAQEEEEEEEEEEEFRTLWVGVLQYWMDEEFIDKAFAGTGEVFTSKVVRNKETGESEGYGFIVFKTHAIAERILHKFNSLPMPRRVVGTLIRLAWAGAAAAAIEPYNEISTTEGQGQCGMNCIFSSKPILPPSIGPATNINTLGDAPPPQFPQEMVTISTWENMLKCWCIFQGTRTAEAVHATHRVYVIGAFFKILTDKCVPPERIEELLDELRGYAYSIDVTKELHSIGALVPLLRNLSSTHVGIRAKAAKVISTMAQNNPRSRQLVMEAGGKERLFCTVYSEDDATTLTNTLDAISSLFRNNMPAITAFGQRKGYEELRHFLCPGCDSRCVKNTLKLVHCLLCVHNPDCNIVTKLGYPRIMKGLAFHPNADLREAALRCLLLLTRVEEGGNSGQLIKNDDELKRGLKRRIKKISAMTPEDLCAASEEIQLVDSLWIACYNEPSSLEGLLVLPCEDAPASDNSTKDVASLLVLPSEDAPASDVASKLFEPPRAWAAAEATDRNYVSKWAVSILETALS